MNTARGRVIQDAQQCRHGQAVFRDGSATSHHYYGPINVNHIGQAHNANFGVNYGSFNQQSSGAAMGGSARPMAETGVNSLLNPILDASHTRNMKHSPPNSQCLPGTRKKVLADIQAWANSDDIKTNPHILWMYGYAGCGKSAIAHEAAKIFAEDNRLAACFVFFRGSGDRSSTARFATTVASQVAAAIPETEPFIASALQKIPGLVSTDTASLSDQFKHLIYRPIHAIVPKLLKPVIIVLDGADECKDHDDISTLIEDMLQFFARHPRTPLRFLITSRVEDHLYQVLHSSTQVRLLNLVERTSDDDIAAALDVLIANAKRRRLLACDKSWPGPQERRELVKHIGGSFLFMTIIIKKLFDQNGKDGLTPMERLPLVLSMKADFDDLYKEILAPWQGLPHFHAVVSTIALAFEPLSVVQLADILTVKSVDVLNVLINLQAIVQVPGDDRSPVTLWHTSLRDFLCNQGRSGRLYAKISHHLRLAYRDLSVRFALQPSSSLYIRAFAPDHLEKYLATLSELERGRLINRLNGPIFNDGSTALEAAILAKKWTLARVLVEAGVNINIQFREPQDGSVCVLHAACLHEQLALIYLLLDKGANPNVVSPNEGPGGFYDGTPLAFAARRGDLKLTTQLLECGANPNLQGGVSSTSLRAACSGNSLKVVNLLLTHGADPNLQGSSDKASPLHACAWNLYDSCARALLMGKADPNIQDNDGDTPLHNASYSGNVTVVECLLAAKANANIKNKKGRTAMQVAQDYWRKRVIAVFHQHGIVE